MTHLANARGILQGEVGQQTVRGTVCSTNGYKGYAALYELEANGLPRLREAAHWAHLRRDLHNFWTSTKCEIARAAREGIGKISDIERDINGQPAEVRHAVRQTHSLPKVVVKTSPRHFGVYYYRLYGGT